MFTAMQNCSVKKKNFHSFSQMSHAVLIILNIALCNTVKNTITKTLVELNVLLLFCKHVLALLMPI